MMTEKESEAKQSLNAQEWLAHTREYERCGEFLRAYDTAISGLKQYPHDLMLQHRSVLVLARSGATPLALQRYKDYDLPAHPSEDIAALGARLSKDSALSETGALRTSKAASAAIQYESIFNRTGGYYPAINAATMYLVAGMDKQAYALAQKVIHTLDRDSTDTQGRYNTGADEDRYYRLASRVEALMILGQADEVSAILADAFQAVNNDWAALASTRRQLRLVCITTGQDTAILDAFLPPTVIHYCGHIIAPEDADGSFPFEQEHTVTQSIQKYFDQTSEIIAFGSLASGADILIAEAILEHGGELHVALPFCLEEFIEVSVRPSGGDWVKRFHHCLESATSVRYATKDSYLGDNQLFTYCSGLAMGLAVLRSRYLDGPINQLAIWDGKPPDMPVGTAFDVSCWRDLNLPQFIISVSGQRNISPNKEIPSSRLVRVQRAMLFGDVKGFSQLKDQELLVFVDQVLGRLADVIESFGDKVCFRNTWGDGIFVVFEEAKDAALCAIAMQKSMSDLHHNECGLPKHLGLRLGGHYGPIYRANDPILKVDNYFGAHVSCTARIEPVTPEGCVYVTEPFAAMLALEDDAVFACDYVGNIPAAKGYGDLSMYLLRHTNST